MRNNQFKVKILLVGHKNAGKSRMANFLADSNLEVPDDVRPTDTLRILEYDVNNVEVNGIISNVDVQLWDTSGDERCISYWPVFRKNTDGVVFVYNSTDDEGAKKLDYMANYFVGQQNLSPRACLVCTFGAVDAGSKPPSAFSKMSQINVNLDGNAEKFRQEFTKYIVSVISTLKQ